MRNFICKYSLVHDKPCKDYYEPSSNNGWIYTSYYYYYCHSPTPIHQVEQLDYKLIQRTAVDCVIETPHDDFIWRRLPTKDRPPISRDELIGKFALNVLPIHALIDNDWYFYNYAKIGIAPFYRQVEGIWYLRNKHRNTVWAEKVYDAYPLAFRLSRFDRHAMRVAHNRRETDLRVKVNLLDMVLFYLYVFTTWLKGSYGEKNICWLQLTLMGKFRLADCMEPEHNLYNYFSRFEDHPIIQFIKDKKLEKLRNNQ